MTNKEEIEDLQANTSDIRFCLLIVFLFVCLFFIIFAITLFNNCNKIDDLEATNQYQLSPAIPDGYVEVCEYETVEKYKLQDLPTEEECYERFLHNSFCTELSPICENMFKDCIEVSKLKPEIISYNESVCEYKTLVKYE